MSPKLSEARHAEKQQHAGVQVDSHHLAKSTERPVMPTKKSPVRLSAAVNAGRRYASIPDAAAYLAVDPLTIRKLISDERIHGFRCSSRLIRVDLNEIDALMAGEASRR